MSRNTSRSLSRCSCPSQMSRSQSHRASWTSSIMSISGKRFQTLISSSTRSSTSTGDAKDRLGGCWLDCFNLERGKNKYSCTSNLCDYYLFFKDVTNGDSTDESGSHHCKCTSVWSSWISNPIAERN